MGRSEFLRRRAGGAGTWAAPAVVAWMYDALRAIQSLRGLIACLACIAALLPDCTALRRTYSVCGSDDECASGVCHGGTCTKSCTANSDCGDGVCSEHFCVAQPVTVAVQDVVADASTPDADVATVDADAAATADPGLADPGSLSDAGPAEVASDAAAGEAVDAIAFADGTVLPPDYATQPLKWLVHGKAVQFGASLVSNLVDYRFNDKLLAESSATVPTAQQLPADALVVAAYVFWGASTSDAGPDGNVALTLADGFTANVTASAPCMQADDVKGVGKHFYCRADVTGLVTTHAGSNHWNGSYTLGGVDAKVAAIQLNSDGITCPPKTDATGQLVPETVCCLPSDPACQSRHASWSMVLVYDTATSEAATRDILLLDGFAMLDERGGPNGNLGQLVRTISGFQVGTPPEALLSYHAFEGDKNLGNPEQDPPGQVDSPACSACPDFVMVNGTKLTGGTGNAEPNNIMNASTGAGIDLDAFDISALLQPGATSLALVVSSGDGVLNPDPTDPVAMAGAGELFFYGYTLMQVVHGGK